MFTLARLAGAARLKARKPTGADTDWQPSARRGFTRRALLGTSAALPAAAVSGRFLHDLGPDPVLLEQPGVIEVLFGRLRWRVHAAAFGPKASISGSAEDGRISIAVEHATWPGTGVNYSLRLAVLRSPGALASWRIRASSEALGFSASADFSDFLQGLGLTARVPGVLGRRIASALGWEELGGQPVRLALFSRADWLLSSSSRWRLRLATLSAEHLRLRVHLPGAGPNDAGLRKAASAWSTSASALDGPVGSVRLAYTTKGATPTRLKVQSSHVAQATTQRWVGAKNLTTAVLQGAWQVAAQVERGGALRFTSGPGSIWLGTDGAAQHAAAVLPLRAEGAQLRVPKAIASFEERAEHHGFAFAAKGGDLRTLRLHGALTTLALPLRGVEYSRLEFEGQDAQVRLTARAGQALAQVVAGGSPLALFGLNRAALSTSLDYATLKVIRGADLLNLTYKFRGFRLIHGITGPRIEPVLRGPKLINALQTEDDRRPVLVAQFPPQHILEQAIYLQVPEGDPGKPSTIHFPNVTLDPWPPLDPSTGALLGLDEIEAMKEARDPDYRAFRKLYCKLANAPYYAPDPPGGPGAPRPDPATVYAAQKELGRKEALPEAVEVHVSSPSRLAFTFALAPGEPGRLARRPVIPFDVDGLTDWAQMELVVAKRARSWETSRSKTQGPQGGRQEPPQELEGDVSALLTFHDVLPGHDLQSRLNDVIDHAVAPSSFETAIEIPARLTLSPDQGARFIASRLDWEQVRSGQPVPLWRARLANPDGESVRAIASPDFDGRVFKARSLGQVPTPPSSENTPPWAEPGEATDRPLRLPLNARDRHELVALTSLVGLPVLPRLPETANSPSSGQERRPQTTALVPAEYKITSGSLKDEQGIYLPPTLTARELTLTGLGGSVDLEGRFEPPAAPYFESGPNANHALFPALTIEGLQQQTVVGYDRRVVVLYKGCHFPTGHRVSLVKQTERFTLRHRTEGLITYLVQRKFLRTPKRPRTYPGLGHPFDAADIPFETAVVGPGRSPDLVDPMEDHLDASPAPGELGILPNGRIMLPIPNPMGLVFWPRTASEAGSEVRFKITCDERPGALTAPLIFVDNEAVHDPPTMEALVKYYETLDPWPDMVALQGLKTAVAYGAPYRYAPETKTGACTFETARLILGARGRGDQSPGLARYVVSAAMEGADQPPFYPYMREGHVNLKTLQRFNARTAPLARVSFHPDFKSNKFAPSHNPGELYLQVHGWLPSDAAHWFSPPQPVQLDMNTSGDRSGGLASPSAQVAAISRLKGAVGGQSVPAPPELRTFKEDDGAPAPKLPAPLKALSVGSLAPPPATSPPPSDPGGSARAGIFNPRDFFRSDAKLLGVISLQDALMAALFATAPELVEQIAAAEAKTDAEIAALRAQLDEIMAQLGEWLATVSEPVDAALADLESRMASTSVGGVAVSDLYPDVAAVISTARARLDALRARIRQGLGADPIADLTELSARVRQFNDALSDLVRSLERLVSNPVPLKLSGFIATVHQAVQLVRDATIASLFSELTDPLKGWAADALTGSDYQAWRAAMLGPDAFDPGTIDVTKPETIVALGRSLAQGIAYEAVGRPALEAYINADRLIRQAQPKVDAMAAGIAAMVAKVFDAVDSLSQAPALNDLLGAGTAACARVDAFLEGTFLAGVDACLADGTLLEDAIKRLELKLADLASSEMAAMDELKAATALLAKLRGEAADRALRVAPRHVAAAASGAQLAATNNEALATAEHALGQLEAAVIQVRRLRLATASILDRLKDSIAALRRERSHLADLLSATCSAVATERVACAARISALRLRAIDDISTLFSALLDALGLGDEKPPQPPALRGNIKAVYAGKGDEDLATAAADFVASAKDISGAALKAGQETAHDLANILENITSLRTAQASGPLLQLLSGLSGRRVVQLSALADRLVQRAAAAKTELATAINDFGSADAVRQAQGARALLRATGAIGLLSMEDERALQGAVAAAVAISARAKADLETQGLQCLQKLAGKLAALHRALYSNTPSEMGLVHALEMTIGPIEAELNWLLNGDVLAALDLTNIKQALVEERQLLEAVQGASQVEAALVALGEYRDRLRTGASAPARLAKQLAPVLDTLAPGHLDQLVDLKRLRRTLADAFLETVFPNLKLSYHLSTGVNDLPPFFAMNRRDTAGRVAEWDQKWPGSDLILDFEMTLNPRELGAARMEAKGRLQPITIDIFDVVSLDFAPATFSASAGESFHLDLKVANVWLGSAVDFLSALSAWMSPSGSTGFYIYPHFNPPGVEAGFAIDLGTISLGTVSFINVALGASVDLPFDNRPAIFRFNLARRGSPFLISAAPFGGGGFLSLLSDAKSIVGFEASFEYGAVVGFSFGPLTGNGRATTGLYISRTLESTTLAGFFVAAGSAHIACFGVNACLLISIEQGDNGAVRGSATFTFSFSLGLAKVGYSVGVARQMSQGWGGGGTHRPAEQQNGAIDRGVQARGLVPRHTPPAPVPEPPLTANEIGKLAALASVEIGETVPQGLLNPGRRRAPAQVRSLVVGMSEDWRRYQAYFEPEL